MIMVHNLIQWIRVLRLTRFSGNLECLIECSIDVDHGIITEPDVAVLPGTVLIDVGDHTEVSLVIILSI